MWPVYPLAVIVVLVLLVAYLLRGRRTPETFCPNSPSSLAACQRAPETFCPNSPSSLAACQPRPCPAGKAAATWMKCPAGNAEGFLPGYEDPSLPSWVTEGGAQALAPSWAGCGPLCQLAAKDVMSAGGQQPPGDCKNTPWNPTSLDIDMAMDRGSELYGGACPCEHCVFLKSSQYDCGCSHCEEVERKSKKEKAFLSADGGCQSRDYLAPRGCPPCVAPRPRCAFPLTENMASTHIGGSGPPSGGAVAGAPAEATARWVRPAADAGGEPDLGRGRWMQSAAA